MANGAINVDVNTSDWVGPATSKADAVFNNSGWTVATSGSKANGGMPQWVLYAAAGLAVLMIIKMKRKGR